MTVTERTEPVDVDTVVTGEWIITLNADREIYRDGAIAVSGGVITEVGKRAAILAKYRPAALIDEPGSIVIPGLINGHRHLLCCAKDAMPEGGQTSRSSAAESRPSTAASSARPASPPSPRGPSSSHTTPSHTTRRAPDCHVSHPSRPGPTVRRPGPRTTPAARVPGAPSPKHHTALTSTNFQHQPGEFGVTG